MSVPVSGLFEPILNLHENDAKKTTVLRMRMMLRQIEMKVHLRKGPHVPAELQQASGQSSSEEHGLPEQKI